MAKLIKLKTPFEKKWTIINIEKVTHLYFEEGSDRVHVYMDNNGIDITASEANKLINAMGGLIK